MKLLYCEDEACFALDFDAETLEDAAFLVRLGMNSTNELRSLQSCVNQKGGFASSVVIAKRKQSTDTIQKP